MQTEIGTTITSTAMIAIASATITIPAAGTVIAQVSGESFFANSSSTNVDAEVELWVCDTSAISCSPGRTWYRMTYSASSPSSPNESFVAANAISFATGGTKTIYLNGHAVSSSKTVSMLRLKWVLLYVPALTP